MDGPARKLSCRAVVSWYIYAMAKITIYSADAAIRKRLPADLDELALRGIEVAGDHGESVVELTAAVHAQGGKILAVFRDAAGCESAAAAGVDDFIVEPFEPAELSARLRRLMDKNGGEAAIVFDGLSIKPDSYEAMIDGRALKLTFKEYELLKHLASNPGRVLSRQALLNQIWEYDYYGGTRTVDVHVRRLRAKLGSRYSDLIKTVRQVGYKFEA